MYVTKITEVHPIQSPWTVKGQQEVYLAMPVSDQLAENRKMLVASLTYLPDPSWTFYHPKRPALNFHDDVGWG